MELKLGDRAAYSSLCHAMLKRHSEVETPAEADFIARICALGPEATDDLKAAVDLAEFAVGRCARHDRPEFLCTLGAILYRAGRFPDALSRLEESVAAKHGRRAIRDRLFLAMAQLRLGRAAESERTFDEATRRTDSPGAEDHPYSWPDRVGIRGSPARGRGTDPGTAQGRRGSTRKVERSSSGSPGISSSRMSCPY